MRVIVAEEDARFRNVLADLLSGEGHTVEVVKSGPEIVASVRAQKPDALVAHARLVTGPVVDVLAPILRESAMRTVLMSGARDTLSQAKLTRLAGVKVLDKPFSFEQLLAVLRN
jgi:DNA-binding response OmpR family regulator